MWALLVAWPAPGGPSVTWGSALVPCGHLLAQPHREGCPCPLHSCSAHQQATPLSGCAGPGLSPSPCSPLLAEGTSLLDHEASCCGLSLGSFHARCLSWASRATVPSLSLMGSSERRCGPQGTGQGTLLQPPACTHGASMILSVQRGGDPITGGSGCTPAALPLS